MILPNTMITLLNTKNYALYNLYACDIIPKLGLDPNLEEDYNDNGYKKILSVDISEDSKYMVKDLDGWTSLISITKLEIPSNKKFFIIDNDVIVTEEELLPVYTPDNYKTAFHGLTIYRHELTKVMHINNRAILRRHMNEFISADVSEVNCNVINGYVLKTKSGFCNMGKNDGYRFHAGLDQKIGYH